MAEMGIGPTLGCAAGGYLRHAEENLLEAMPDVRAMGVSRVPCPERRAPVLQNLRIPWATAK